MTIRWHYFYFNRLFYFLQQCLLEFKSSGCRTFKNYYFRFVIFMSELMLSFLWLLSRLIDWIFISIQECVFPDTLLCAVVIPLPELCYKAWTFRMPSITSAWNIDRLASLTEPYLQIFASVESCIPKYWLSKILVFDDSWYERNDLCTMVVD